VTAGQFVPVGIKTVDDELGEVVVDDTAVVAAEVLPVWLLEQKFSNTKTPSTCLLPLPYLTLCPNIKNLPL
jgi:hypothetical protein